MEKTPSILPMMNEKPRVPQSKVNRAEVRVIGGVRKDTHKQGVETSMGGSKLERNSNSKDLTHSNRNLDKRLKNSETCPDQLTPKLPLEEKKLVSYSRKANII